MPARDLTPAGPGDLPAGYAELLEALKERVRTSRVRAARAANTELLRLYHSIGRDILVRQQRDGWGGKVIDRLAQDLRAAFPDQRGFSRRNLHYMRAVATAWPDEADFVQQPAAQMPWTHLTVLLDRLEEPATRQWYAARALQHGWSRNVLEHHIATRLHQRTGAAPSNFAAHLPPIDSDLAQQLTRDPYVFDHLDATDRASEKRLEQALMDRLQATLSAFGHGMAFVGRQVHFTVGGDELIVDLLFFHVEQLRYVVVELKIGRFQPGYLGQLSTYVAMVDDKLRRPQHLPTVGILLVAGRNEAIVRYALAGAAAPVAVATYDTLSPEQRAGLPDPALLSAELTSEVSAVLTDTLDELAGQPSGQPTDADTDADSVPDTDADSVPDDA
ncbi:PDDEXK nuclease domain-containing protein [Kineococcus sp. SYSU DK005]|uniref:PDDEXK nuclease domain-containing protein n=1 Tax=Kineococcus sp. SYSU DK005 TaxID=3383126 RepID=UPI003D7E832A